MYCEAYFKANDRQVSGILSGEEWCPEGNGKRFGVVKLYFPEREIEKCEIYRLL